jgi:hypothetical protein
MQCYQTSHMEMKDVGQDSDRTASIKRKRTLAHTSLPARADLLLSQESFMLCFAAKT